MTVEAQGDTVGIRSEDIVMRSDPGEQGGDIVRFREDVQLHLPAPTHAPGKLMAFPGAAAGAAPADTRESDCRHVHDGRPAARRALDALSDTAFWWSVAPMWPRPIGSRPTGGGQLDEPAHRTHEPHLRDRLAVGVE